MEKNTNTSTFSKVTAVLCALTILLSIVAFFDMDAVKVIEMRNSQIERINEQIAQKETLINQCQENIARFEEEKQAKEEPLAAAKGKVTAASKVVLEAKTALDTAERNLDQVCYRSSYSYYSCSAECQPLHTAVTNAKNNKSAADDQLDLCKDAVSDIEDEIRQLDNSIAASQETIQQANVDIASMKYQIKGLKKELGGAWAMTIFSVLAMLLASGSLGLLAKAFYEENIDKFVLYAVAGMAGSSLLFFFSSAIGNARFMSAPLLFILISPYVWNIAIMGLLAAILTERTDKPVALRNTAVVFSVIMGVLLVLVNPLVAPLYLVTSICIAFMIAPLVFTPYIPIAKHIFLSLITCGIWTLIWVYHVTKNLNDVEGVEERKPVCELLLSAFLPLYSLFWLYKTAEGVEDFGRENGKEFKIDVLCLAFAFICPLFATVLIQNKINVVVGKPVAVVEEIQAEEIPEEVQEEIPAES